MIKKALAVLLAVAVLFGLCGAAVLGASGALEALVNGLFF